MAKKFDKPIEIDIGKDMLSERDRFDAKMKKIEKRIADLEEKLRKMEKRK